MGYTHYWDHTKGFSDTEWTEVLSALKAIAVKALASGIALSADNGDTPLTNHAILGNDLIVDWGKGPVFQINGMGEQAHETFSIRKVAPAAGDTFDFTKTAQKPYDVVVTAMLIFLESLYPDRINARSDGSSQDWQAGLALARQALPKVMGLDLPHSLRWEDLWGQHIAEGNTLSAALTKGTTPKLCIIQEHQVLAEFEGSAIDAVRSKITKVVEKASLCSDYKARYDAIEKGLNRISRSCEALGGSKPEVQPLAA